MTHRWTIPVIVTLAVLVTAVSSAHSTDMWQDNPVQTHYGRPIKSERTNHFPPASGTTSVRSRLHSAEFQSTSEGQVPDFRILWLHRLSNLQYCRLSQYEP